jgi:hypothetical protein
LWIGASGVLLQGAFAELLAGSNTVDVAAKGEWQELHFVICVTM